MIIVKVGFESYTNLDLRSNVHWYIKNTNYSLWNGMFQNKLSQVFYIYKFHFHLLYIICLDYVEIITRWENSDLQINTIEQIE